MNCTNGTICFHTYQYYLRIAQPSQKSSSRQQRARTTVTLLPHCHLCDGSVTNQRQAAQHSTEQCGSSSRRNGKTNEGQSAPTQSKIITQKMKQNDTPITTNSSKYKGKRNCRKKRRSPHHVHCTSPALRKTLSWILTLGRYVQNMLAAAG